MKCHKARIQLKEYLDNQLPDKQQAKLERHLAACPDCRAELAFIKAYRFNLAAMRPQATPPDLLAQIRCQLSSEPTLPQDLRKVFRPLPVLLPGLAGTALLTVLVVWLAKPWEFSLNAPAVNQPVAQTAAPAPTASQSVESTSKQIPAGRADVPKSVAAKIAPKSMAESPLQSTSKSELEPILKSASESTSKSELEPILKSASDSPPKSELESILKSVSESTSKSTPKAPSKAAPVISVDPAADQSGETLLKSITPPRKGQTLAEAVVAVAIPAVKPVQTKSLGAGPDDEAGAADMVGPRLRNLLKSIDGVIIREETADRWQLPLQISITISPGNYSRLIAGLKELGEVIEPFWGGNSDNSDLRLKLEIYYQAGLR